MAALEYSPNDLLMLRQSYTDKDNEYLPTEAGQEMARTGEKYILIPSEVMPMIAEVDQYAATAKGKGITLTWSPDKAGVRCKAALAGTPLPSGRGSVLLSREEYPYNSFAQGEVGAHVGLVPLHENWVQGGFIRAASMLQGFRPGDTIKVVIFDGQ